MPAGPSAQQQIRDSRKKTLRPLGERGGEGGERGDAGRVERGKRKNTRITSSPSLVRHNDMQEVCQHLEQNVSHFCLPIAGTKMANTNSLEPLIASETFAGSSFCSLWERLPRHVGGVPTVVRVTQYVPKHNEY